jgi:biotin-(acetyl-CoA carboxylase) ligase
VDDEELLESFLELLESRFEALRAGAFDAAAWRDRQATTGRLVRLTEHAADPELVRATGVDTETGALLVDGDRPVYSGDVVHVRLAAGV